MRGAREAYSQYTDHLAEASSVDNAWDAYRARACTSPVEVVPFPASSAVREVRTLGWGCGFYSLRNIIPDQGSIEGKHKHSREIAPPAEQPSPPRTRVVASVGGLEVQGVVNAVVWRGAGRGGCECIVSLGMATSSLGSRINTVSNRSQNPTMGHTDGRGFSNFCVFEGVEVVLDMHNGCLLDRDSKERVRF
jgi:hypothetical protein